MNERGGSGNLYRVIGGSLASPKLHYEKMLETKRYSKFAVFLVNGP